MILGKKIRLILLGGSNRTKVVKKNILASLFVKGLSIVTSLLLVPATLDLIDTEKYGLWITIYSIVTWFNMMDIGLGNGFRNKFTQAISLKKLSEAKEYLSTLYTSTFLISIAIVVIYFIISPFLNWNSILNTSNTFNEDIDKILAFVFVLFAIQLTVKNVTTILLALQKTALSGFVIFLGNLLALVAIYTLGKLGMATLFSIALSFMLAPIIVWMLATIYLFKTSLKDLSSIKISVSKFSEIMGLGIKFFFIQIAAIVMFGSGNFIITRLFGPSEVTPYNIAYRLFSASITIFAIIKAPFWSAYTEAFVLKDYKWVKKSLNKLIQLWAGFSLIIGVALIFSNFIYDFWIGGKVDISWGLSVQFAIYAILMSWTGIFSQLLNGIGIIKLQLIIALIQCVNVIPLGIFLAKNLGFGSTGVVLSINLNLLLAAVFLYVQSNKIINGKAKGVWIS